MSRGEESRPSAGTSRKTVAPLPVSLKEASEHVLEFYFDQTGHVTGIVCSCGKESKVEML